MPDSADRHLLQRIRDGDEAAWQELIDCYEGRLTAFVESRLRNRTASEDVVQEAFLGFLLSLPNYDERTPLESWLFSIAAHKLTDYLRKTGRRPTVSFVGSESRPGASQIRGDARKASSLMRSRERIQSEEEVIEQTLRELVSGWKRAEEWERLECLELLFVLGWKNKDVAGRLNISEQAVANHKAFVMQKLKDAIGQARLPGFRLADYVVE